MAPPVTTTAPMARPTGTTTVLPTILTVPVTARTTTPTARATIPAAPSSTATIPTVRRRTAMVLPPIPMDRARRMIATALAVIMTMTPIAQRRITMAPLVAHMAPRMTTATDPLAIPMVLRTITATGLRTRVAMVPRAIATVLAVVTTTTTTLIALIRIATALLMTPMAPRTTLTDLRMTTATVLRTRVAMAPIMTATVPAVVTTTTRMAPLALAAPTVITTTATDPPETPTVPRMIAMVLAVGTMIAALTDLLVTTMARRMITMDLQALTTGVTRTSPVGALDTVTLVTRCCGTGVF